jgi:hypothetical protein
MILTPDTARLELDWFFSRAGWEFDFAAYPDDPNAYVEDQAVRFHRPLEVKSDSDADKEDKETVSRGPKPTDWRWGPGNVSRSQKTERSN